MSSYLRTIAKRILKKAGYTRQTHQFVEIGGDIRKVAYAKGKGPMLDPAGEPLVKGNGKLSTLYPHRIPAALGMDAVA